MNPAGDTGWFGTYVFSPDPAVTEIIGLTGFDFVIFDQEHASLSTSDIAQLIRAAVSVGLVPYVRVGEEDVRAATRALDAGAQGIVLPHLGMGSDAAFASRMRYPPRGDRPTCRGVRAGGFGTTAFAETAKAANEEILLIGQVEDREVVARVEELATSGLVDVILPGPSDLASSFGYPGELDRPEVVTAVESIVKDTVSAGVPSGMYLSEPEDISGWLDRGARWFILGIDYTVLSNAFRSLRGRIPS